MLRTTLAVFLTLLIFSSFAQDANYWSSNYGPGGFFTPGAVVANNRDSGVFFYNPALLGLSSKNSTSISANVYRLESINIKNGVGTGKNLTNNVTSIVPLMASGAVSIKGITIGYALINNPIINFSVTQRQDSKINVLADSYSPGDEYYIGQYNAQNTLTATAGILSAGKKLSDKLTAGISIEGTLLKQYFNINTSARALVNNPDSIFPPLVSAVSSYLVKYTHIGLRFKAGIAYDINNEHHFGLMITIPTLKLGGSGTLVSDQVLSNIRDAASGIQFNLLANGRQEHLKPKYKTPVSIAGGYIYEYGKGQVYLSAEYFARISEYNIITPRNELFIRPDTANNAATSSLLKLKDLHKAVTNFAVGFSCQLRKNLMGYISLRTDFTYADPARYKDEEGYAFNTSVWNNYHMQIGANVQKRKFNLRAGLLLGYGTTTKYRQDINYDHPSEENFLLGEPGYTRATHLSAGLMFSYIHNL